MMTIKIEDNKQFTIGSGEDNDMIIYDDETIEKKEIAIYKDNTNSNFYLESV